MDDLKRMLSEVSREEMMSTIRWMVEHVPYRLAGSPDEARASEYVSARMREYGLEVENETFRTYNSEPMNSRVTIVSPIEEEIASLPCAHIRATAPEGELRDVVYIGTGARMDYEGLDVKGKLVLAEVSYAPPVPEKARIASQKGAAGIICMNWGNDEEVICHRGLKAVWGNPTEETFPQIPDLIGVGITRKAGLRLKELCQSGEPVRVRISASADRRWSLVHQPKGILRGNGRHDQFLLVCSHLDAWKPGVTCNATGNATTLEICRLFAANREKLDRDVCFVFWNGHEIAEAAGSTWFVDNYWDSLNRRCAAYMHIDSTGVGQTKIFEIKASEELLSFAKHNYAQTEGEREIRAMSLKKIGDQSFMGIGVPSVTQRMSFTEADMEKAHGATLGWWNHTCEDTIDKCDPDILVTDTKVTLSLLYRLANAERLPYELEGTFEALQRKMEGLSERYRNHVDFGELLRSIEEAARAVRSIQETREQYSGEAADCYNRFVMSVCRHLTNVVQTYADKYQQDSYGFTKLTAPIPLFADLERLERLKPDTLEYGMVHTQIIKNKNRIGDAMKTISELAELYDTVLKTRP